MKDTSTENQAYTEDLQQLCVGAESGIGEQGADGYDLSMFRANLSRTPTKRIERLQSVLVIFKEVRSAGRDYRLSIRDHKFS